MKEITRAAHALSDETRLRILNLVMEHECCVCEVMQALGISQTRASRNLKILFDAGFLKLRNDGLFTLYSLDGAGGNFHGDLVSAVKKGLEGNISVEKDVERLHKSKRIGPVCSNGKGVTCPTC
jgi:ArsR family transcriptional regulator